MKSLALPLAVLTLAGAGSAFAQLSPAPGVRVWSGPDFTRVAIEMSEQFVWTADRAVNPDRLFFDVRGGHPAAFRRGEQTVSVGDALVKRVRMARWQPSVFRIVFDLTRPADYTVSQLSSPDRMIIELHVSGSEPAISMAPKEPATRATRTTAASVPATQSYVARTVTTGVGTGTTRVRGNIRYYTPPRLRFARLRPSVFYFPPPRLDEAPVVTAFVIDPTRPRERAGRSLPGANAAMVRTDGPVSLTRALGLKVGRIVIDAGHGGHDTGTAGPTGLLEKDLVLDVAHRLGDIVEKRLGAEVVYTRPDDTFIALQERTRMANDRKADLFLSIHANSSPASNASGIETYYLNFTTNQSALEVAARENAASEHTVNDLGSLVQIIAKNDKVEESRQFAARMQSSMYTFSVRGNAASKDRGVKKAPFVVLIGARMPSVLCEIGFLSNPKDESLLKKAEYRQKLAEALYRGLAGYAGTLSHIQLATR